MSIKALPSLRVISIFILAVALMVGLGMAQVTTARLEGVVKDATDAVVPGVAVTAINEATNLTYETLTNETGLYIFPRLIPGTYTITAELPGFKRSVTTSIPLQLGDTATVNLDLETGEISEEVIVTGEAPTVDRVSQVIGNVVQEDQIKELPLLDRNPMMLYYLQAGVNPIERDGGQQQTGNVDGLCTIANNVTVEGVYAMDPFLDFSPANPSFATPSESVGEYRVVTSSASAEYGRGGGAQVQVIYKSGTNEFHGSAYNYLRNTIFNANNFFNNRQGVERPTFKRNQFGFSVGGPIWKNRAFFFGTYEGERQREDTIVNKNTYTQTARNGIFRYYNKGQNSSSLVDPLTGVPNVPASDIGTINVLEVDPTRLGKDPTGIVDNYLSQTPLPNNFDLGDGFNLGGYRFNSLLPWRLDQFAIKGDLQLNTNHQVAVSFARMWRTSENAQLISGYPQTYVKRRKISGSIGLTSTFTPHLLNEARAGAQERWYKSTPGHPDTFSVPNFQMYGLGSGRGGGTNGMPRPIYLPQSAPGASINIVDNMTWIKGNHTFKWGLDIRINRSNVDFGGDHYIPVVSTQNSNNPATLPPLADLDDSDQARAQQMTNDLTGAVGWIRQDFFSNTVGEFSIYEGSWRRWRNREYGFFFQDTWKALPNLTLNLGLRYEVFPATYEKDGLFAQPIGGFDGMLGVAGPTRQPTEINVATNRGKDTYATDWNNFAPNVGFNWDPFGDGKWSISSNFRISFDRAAMVTMLFQDYNNEGMKAQRQIFPGGRFGDAAALIPLPIPEMFEPLPVGARQSQVITYQNNLRTPYTQSWSLRIQREIMRNTVLQVAYVGNHSVGQLRGLNYNQVETVQNGFIDGFLAAQRNFFANGDPNTGESTGVLGQIMSPLGGIPSSYNGWIERGEVARVADDIDRNKDPSNNLLEQAGLPITYFRLNPQFQHARAVSTLTHSSYNGLKIELNRRFHQGLHLGFNYTFGKGLTDYDGGQSQSNDYRDNNNRWLDKTRSNFDSTHVINANYIWELPVGRGRRWMADMHPVLNGFIGGWQINGIVAYASGQPVTIDSGRYTLTMGDDSTANYSGKGFGITGVTKGDQIRLITEAQKSLFSFPVAGNAGQSAQNVFITDDATMIDTSIMKEFGIPYLGEEGALQFRFELFNTFNQTDFEGFSRVISSGDFGVVNSARNARRMQFSLRLQW